MFTSRPVNTYRSETWGVAENPVRWVKVALLFLWFSRISQVGFVYSWWRSTVTDGCVCRQEHFTHHCSLAQCAHWMMSYVLHQIGSRTCLCASPYVHGHPWWAVEPSFFSSVLLNLFFHVDHTPKRTSPAPPPIQMSCPWQNSLFAQLWMYRWRTGLPPDLGLAHGYHETLCQYRHNSLHRTLLVQCRALSHMISLFASAREKDMEHSYLCDAELDNETTWKARFFTTVIKEREESAKTSLSLFSKRAGCQLQSFSVCHVSSVRPLHEFSSPSFCTREKPSREMENETFRILLQRQRENFRYFSEVTFRNTNFKPIPGIEEQYRVSAKRNGSCSSGRWITSSRSLTSSWTIIGMCSSFRGVATSE